MLLDVLIASLLSVLLFMGLFALAIRLCRPTRLPVAWLWPEVSCGALRAIGD